MNSENKPNNKAPRMGKSEFAIQVFTKELFKNFIQENPQYKGKIDWKGFKSAWVDVTDTIRSEAVMNPLGVKLPFYLGELKTRFLPKRPRNLIDMAHLSKTGEITSPVAILTRGKIFKVIWERRLAIDRFKMLKFFAFEEDKRIRDLSKVYVPENAASVRIAQSFVGIRRFKKNK